MNKQLTGHLYLGSSYETCNSCGNCNGANCDSCETEWIVEGKVFYNMDEARAAEELTADLIVYEGTMYNTEYANFFVKDNELWAHIYASEYIDVPCNKDNAAYSDRLTETIDRHAKWEECTCTNKDNENDSNPCCIYGCRDSYCYFEMKECGRTEQKWYM